MNQRKTMKDRLRATERKIDNAYKESPLASLSRSQALWCFLTECEERYMREPHPDFLYESGLSDELMNLAKWPMRWLWRCCKPSGEINRSYNSGNYKAATGLADLGAKYISYETAFTYWSKGLLELHLEDRLIRSTGYLRDNTRWDVYDRLIGNNEKPHSIADEGSMSDASQIVRPHVRANGEKFKYDLNPKLFRAVAALTAPIVDRRFGLPLEWEFANFTIGDYATVLKCLWTLSVIHFAAFASARSTANSEGRPHGGYQHAIPVTKRSNLISRIAGYTTLERHKVQHILEDLTFGQRDMLYPDVALQPIVPLGSKLCGWSPTLVINSALERNLLVLMNRLPDGKDAYSRISENREELLRTQIKNELAGLGLRFWHGKVPHWGQASDVDLVIVDEPHKCCLLLELKSLLDPADPREILDKAQEIKRGVKQIRERRKQLLKNWEPLYKALGIDSKLVIHSAVASESTVACGLADSREVPVVRSSHLIALIKSEADLRKVCEKLSKGDFLPVRGKDYRELTYKVSIDHWTLESYGYHLLTETYL